MNSTEQGTVKAANATGTRFKATNARGISSFFDTEEQSWVWVRTGKVTGEQRVVMTCSGKTRSRGSRKMTTNR